ncbi:Acyl-CoA reductase [Fontimonas thermophila]|uniref:Aldehyde dehydrogenase n=1 Tax=Fontimonas thermophila TaxID=1076937 RepID=A0A1I2JBE7_9GAMM|nr:aldehyde dehydrogenase family protein [Fontimonas thermophila]SFF51143.1 Acyl-CoA reductase [Fontimonas thermophila]
MAMNRLVDAPGPVPAAAVTGYATGAVSSRIIECFNPATGVRLGSVPAATPEEVVAAVQRARIAQRAWAASRFAERRAVLGHLLDHILVHVDEICAAIVEVSGKTWEHALLGEIMPVCTKIRWMLRNAERYLKPEHVSSGWLLHKKARIEYHPLGVVACIVPWNYPFQNVFGSLLAPLMAGNAVIVKPSEMVAWASARFRRILDEALTRAGFSPDTVQIVDGTGETGAALVKSGVQKILFIGSVGNGRRIVEGSAQTLTPVVMELGGKDPLIVCDDADLDQAVHASLGGCFINLGQNCIAAERLFVHAGIYERFVEAVQRRTAALRQGVPHRPGVFDVGAITSPAQLQIIDTLVQDAIARGARALVGGRRGEGPGLFYPPTILVDVTPDMRIAREEVFGPVMLIFKVADDAEAIRLANDSAFGLQSCVFTRDRARGERIAAALQAGGTCINDFGLCYLAQDLPFGGIKASGYGRMNGRDGLRAYTNAKAVLTDRFAFSVPPKVFPVGPDDYVRARWGLRLLFARRWRDRLRYLFAPRSSARPELSS